LKKLKTQNHFLAVQYFIAIAEESLEGLLNKSKGWKAAFGMRSIREL